MIDKPKIDKAMILAAGKGTRMRAAPDDPPKPLTEIAGQSLLARMMDRMRDTGIRHIVVNLHHKADWLETMLADYARAHDEVTLSLSDERDVLLETGGGVKKALPLLGDGPFLVANADLLWQETGPLWMTCGRLLTRSICRPSCFWPIATRRPAMMARVIITLSKARA